MKHLTPPSITGRPPARVQHSLHSVPQLNGRTLLAHVPKTGGTSVDSIISSHYESAASTRLVSHASTNFSFDGLSTCESKYLSGHIPYAAVSHLQFDRRITILRDPVDVLCSINAFVKETGYFNDEVALALEIGCGYSVYGVYFSPGFDVGKYLIDRRFGIARGYQPYFTGGDVTGAIAALSQFTNVFDFSKLDQEMKRLIVEEELFPPSSLPNRRSYSYTRDLESALPLLTKFDIDFYKAACQFFKPEIRDAEYEQYRQTYCENYGIQLDVLQSCEMNLGNPVGSGWNDAELSELGTMFRWSEVREPWVDIPLARAGTYSVSIYANDLYGRGVSMLADCLGTDIQVQTQVQGTLQIFTVQLTISTPSWLSCRLSMGSQSERPASVPGDDRLVGFVLANVYVRRCA